MHPLLEQYEKFAAEAKEAYGIFLTYYPNAPRIPGASTVIRLANYIAHGRTIEEAAGREYLYRWNLAIKAPDQCIGHSVRNPCVSVFGTPHTLGM